MYNYSCIIIIYYFSFDFILDAASYLTKQLQVKVIYEDFEEDPGEEIRVQNTYTYKNYNQVEEIPSLQMSERDQVDLDEIEELEQQTDEVKEIGRATCRERAKKRMAGGRVKKK